MVCNNRHLRKERDLSTFLGHVCSPVSSLFPPILINVQAHTNITSKCVTSSLNGFSSTKETHKMWNEVQTKYHYTDFAIFMVNVKCPTYKNQGRVQIHSLLLLQLIKDSCSLKNLFSIKRKSCVYIPKPFQSECTDQTQNACVNPVYHTKGLKLCINWGPTPRIPTKPEYTRRYINTLQTDFQKKPASVEREACRLVKKRFKKGKI